MNRTAVNIFYCSLAKGSDYVQCEKLFSAQDSNLGPCYTANFLLEPLTISNPSKHCAVKNLKIVVILTVKAILIFFVIYRNCFGRTGNLVEELE
jgi:hypothetical protein